MIELVVHINSEVVIGGKVVKVLKILACTEDWICRKLINTAQSYNKTQLTSNNNFNYNEYNNTNNNNNNKLLQNLHRPNSYYNHYYNYLHQFLKKN